MMVVLVGHHDLASLLVSPYGAGTRAMAMAAEDIGIAHTVYASFPAHA
jgi:hypothetical protein